jgi:demethylmenaquinone methyltransferase / 2-methoxy-6-polyprenyl-1,4-benzoquinol methylase
MDSYYNSIAQGYEELHREEQLEKMQVLLKLAQHHKIIQSTDLLLDVGCGTGLTTAPWPCRTIGIDPAFQLLQRAPHGMYVNAEAEHLPFGDKTFDVVVSVTALQNFYDLPLGLSEMHRVGKKWFILTFLKKSQKSAEIEKHIRHFFTVHSILDERVDRIFLCKN